MTIILVRTAVFHIASKDSCEKRLPVSARHRVRHRFAFLPKQAPQALIGKVELDLFMPFWVLLTPQLQKKR